MGRFQSGQMGRTVNPLAYAFVGSIPTRPTIVIQDSRSKVQNIFKCFEFYILNLEFVFAQVVELVDTTVLEAVASRCKSSSLFLGTTK